MTINIKIAESDIARVKNELTDLFSLDNPLYKEIDSFLLGTSKYIRSTLAILYIKAQQREIPDEAIKIMSVGEIIHNASILHDDVLDNADYRRGKKTISKQFAPKVSVLSGDFLLMLGVKKIFDLKNEKINHAFIDCIEKMIRAEILQNEFEWKNPSEKVCLNICEGKTAELFGVILQNSALYSNLDTETAYKFGKLFGMLFQLKNDTDSISALQDEKNGIKTLIKVLGVEKTLSLADNYKRTMRSIFDNFPDNIYKEELKSLVENL